MPKISLIIPYLEIDSEKKAVLDRMLKSVEGQYDELLLMTEKSDCLAKEINKGLAKATGDFLVVSNDDVIMHQGSLRDLAVEDKVMVPKVIGSLNKQFHGHMWCMSRKIYEDVGPQWEGYDGFYFDDSDYWMSIEAKGYPIINTEDVVIMHPHPARTLSQLFKAGREEDNRKKFVDRWGEESLKKIM